VCKHVYNDFTFYINFVIIFSTNPSDWLSAIHDKWILLGNLNFYASNLQQFKVEWVVFFIIFVNMFVFAIGGYIISKYWFKVSIQSTLLFVMYDDFGAMGKILQLF
jgi:hypothetical protein